MGRYRPGVVVALAAIVLLGACQKAVEPLTTEPTDPPEWLTLEVRYSSRHSLGKRRLDVLTTNEGPAQVMVTSIALRSDHFLPLAPEAKNSVVRSGATVALKTDFGPLAGCESGQELEAVVVMDVSIDGADPISLRVPIDPEPLDRIRVLECNEAAVRQAVGVSFDAGWTREGTSVQAELVFTRLVGEKAVVVEAVGGMILFGMQPNLDRGPPLAVLDPGSDSVVVPVVLILIRCDVHAVSQAPDGYAFRVWIAVGDREAIAITILAPPSLQAQLEELVDQCIGA